MKKIFWLLLIFPLLIQGYGLAAVQAVPEEPLGILLVAFGSSSPRAKAAYEKIQQRYEKEFPGSPIVWAFTSQKIRKKLAREGKRIGGIAEGLERLAQVGSRVARVQSLHMLAGEEFSGLERAVLLALAKNPDRFDAVYLGRPLLESREDAARVADAIFREQIVERDNGEPVLLMGHGQARGRGDLILEGTKALLKEKDDNVHLAAVEGSLNFDGALSALGGGRGKKIWLAPLMLVAGEHARNDLAGETDSWAARLKEAGWEVRPVLTGLGELPSIGDLFADHTRKAVDNILQEPRKE